MLLDDFKARFPEFEASKVDAVFSVLESSYNLYYGETYSADNADVILQLLAHLFVNETMMNKTMGGVVEEVDDEMAFFKTTKYGQRFMLLIKHHHGGKPV